MQSLFQNNCMLTTTCWTDGVKVTLIYFIPTVQWVGLGRHGPIIVIAHKDINIRRFLHVECTRTDALCCLIHHKRGKPHLQVLWDCYLTNHFCSTIPLYIVTLRFETHARNKFVWKFSIIYMSGIWSYLMSLKMNPATNLRVRELNLDDVGWMRKTHGHYINPPLSQVATSYLSFLTSAARAGEFTWRQFGRYVVSLYNNFAHRSMRLIIPRGL